MTALTWKPQNTTPAIRIVPAAIAAVSSSRFSCLLRLLLFMSPFLSGSAPQLQRLQCFRGRHELFIQPEKPIQRPVAATVNQIISDASATSLISHGRLASIRASRGRLMAKMNSTPVARAVILDQKKKL